MGILEASQSKHEAAIYGARPESNDCLGPAWSEVQSAMVVMNRDWTEIVRRTAEDQGKKTLLRSSGSLKRKYTEIDLLFKPSPVHRTGWLWSLERSETAQNLVELMKIVLLSI